jgi:hypothetical protein
MRSVDELWYHHAPGPGLEGGARGADKREALRTEVAIGEPGAHVLGAADLLAG